MSRVMTEPHPLESAVREVFAKRSPLDRITLAMGLADPDPFSATMIQPGADGPRLGISPNRAYRVVAEDVLGVMLAQGKVLRDEFGSYRLVG